MKRLVDNRRLELAAWNQTTLRKVKIEESWSRGNAMRTTGIQHKMKAKLVSSSVINCQLLGVMSRSETQSAFRIPPFPLFQQVVRNKQLEFGRVCQTETSVRISR